MVISIFRLVKVFHIVHFIVVPFSQSGISGHSQTRLKTKTRSGPRETHSPIPPHPAPLSTGNRPCHFPVWCLHRLGSTTRRDVFVLISKQQTISVFPQKLKGLRMPTGQQTIQKQSAMVKRTANNLAMTARKQNKTGPPRAKQTARTALGAPHPPFNGRFHSNRFVFVIIFFFLKSEEKQPRIIALKYYAFGQSPEIVQTVSQLSTGTHPIIDWHAINLRPVMPILYYKH